MRQAPGESVQKLCPSCSTLAYTAEQRCPWCGASYKRRFWAALIALALVQVALVLAGVALMFEYASEVAQDRFDSRADRIERDLDESFEEVQRTILEELDRRLPEE